MTPADSCGKKKCENVFRRKNQEYVHPPPAILPSQTCLFIIQLEQDLLASIPAWELEACKPFLVHGESILQLLR